ncbi:MAG: type VI secretion system tube protein Hcp [Sedimenticola sp.]
MAVDFFLKIEGIKGESRDDAHKDEIDVTAWDWGMSQTGSMHIGGGGGTGKVSVNDLSITKTIDKSTPNLMKSCTTGKHFAEATLVCRKATGDKPLEYLVLKLKDVLISNISVGGSESNGGVVTENVTLNFASFEYAYTPQNEKGASEGVVKHGFNIEKNVAA